MLMMQNMDYSRYLPTEETDEIVSIHSKVHCALERINKEAVLGCSGDQFAVGRIRTHERCRRTRGLIFVHAEQWLSTRVVLLSMDT